VFDAIEMPPRPWTPFLIHFGFAYILTPIAALLLSPVALVLEHTLSPIAGEVAYSLAVAGGIGWFVARRWPHRSATFVWVPGFVLYVYDVIGLLRRWEITRPQIGRWEYAVNTMFGPNCSDTECLGVLFSAMLMGTFSYSLGSYFCLRRTRMRSASTREE
jgi:hypothetical protein